MGIKEMKVALKAVAILAILVLFCAGNAAVAYPEHKEKSCPCCAKERCHDSHKCHNTAKQCQCTVQLTIGQTILENPGYLAKTDTEEPFTYNHDLIYIYLPEKDIFHPPRV